jgi:hypothetical protein
MTRLLFELARGTDIGLHPVAVFRHPSLRARTQVARSLTLFDLPHSPDTKRYPGLNAIDRGAKANVKYVANRSELFKTCSRLRLFRQTMVRF